MPFLERDGAQLYYETHGAGPALLFAHGLGGGHLSWWQQVPHFRDRYTCVTFDHRGFGLSRETPGGRGPDAYVEDLAALVDHLGLHEVRLVAQSMGGWTCLDYALRHPDRVRALVLACTIGTLSDPETERIFREHAAGRPEAALAARNIHPACGERMAREQPALHFLYREVDALSSDLDKDRGAEEAHRDADDAARDGCIASRAPPLHHGRGGCRHAARRRRHAGVDRPRRPARSGAGGGPLRLLGAPGDLQPPRRRVPGHRGPLTTAVPPFETTRLPARADTRAPDGAEVRILLQLAGGSVAHFELGAGRVSRAVTHRTVDEIWYVIGGRGEMWRRQGDRESVVALETGVCVTIPLGTHFQFRSLGPGPLAAVAVTMPPWPGPDEAVLVPGTWPSTEPAG